MGRLRIVYEDESIIVADKPAGLLTVSTPKKEKTTLVSLLKAYPAHRLDRDTSGLIVLAKTRKIQDALMAQFKSREVKKKYIAFVRGKPMKDSGVIDGFIRDNPYEAPKYAKTQYRILKKKNDFCVVEVSPITGRTNQIRIHFKQIGHPLLGERRFAFARDFPIKFKRTALHASDLEFIHPVNRKKMQFHLDLPKDMEEFLSAH